MQSLLLPSSFTTNTLHSRPNSAPKPPTCRLVVSCKGSGDAIKVDRRNVLLGIGGLYGVRTLATPGPSVAQPLPPVDMDVCSKPVDAFTGQPLDLECCPPKPMPEPVPFTFPSFTKLRVRPALHLASPETLANYEKAVRMMKALPSDDPRNFMQQANVHCAYCNLTYAQSKGSDIKLQIHNCNQFFPWHRWYLYFYERILGKLIGDPSFGLPFWNWDHPNGMVMADVFTNEDSPVYNVMRDLTHYPPATSDLRFAGNQTENLPEARVVENNLAQVKKEIVDSPIPKDFYGVRYVLGSKPNDETGMGSVESGSHTAVHRWVGTETENGFDMGNFATAGREPIFFTHHTNIDRLWTVWRGIQKEAGRPVNFVDDNFNDDQDWLDSEYLFYDEEKRLVKVNVKDSLDSDKLGYRYQKVDNSIWLDHESKPNARGSNITKIAAVPKAKSTVFPAKLDKVLQFVVDRPRKSRSKREKQYIEELLVIQGIEVDTAKFVRFEVFVNDEGDKPDERIVNSEYAGCFSQVPNKNSFKGKSRRRLRLTNLLEELECEDDDQILVSIVPRAGCEDLTIGGIKIIYERAFLPHG